MENIVLLDGSGRKVYTVFRKTYSVHVDLEVVMPVTFAAPVATPVTATGGLAAPLVGAVAGSPRRWLRLEGLAVLAGAAAVYHHAGAGWGWFAVLFLLPDLSFVGYLLGPRVGAAAYNLMHSYVGPVVLALGVHAAGAAALLSFALIWAAHIGFDRMLGYGLKYQSAFGDTHLGRVGRSAA